MKVLIVVTMTNNFGKKGSYNSQEIGLARGLTELGHDVAIYKSVVNKDEAGEEQINSHAKIIYIKCPYMGSNGLMPTKSFDRSADVLIQFADIQLSVPRIYRWAIKNGIKYIPYVGVDSSRSHNRIIKFITESLGKRNFQIYRMCGCAAKNTDIAQRLKDRGIKNVRLAPVCIDFEQVKKDCADVDRATLRKKWKIPENARVILFVGRLIKNKRPVDLVNLFSKLEKNSFLIMIGTGMLKNTVKSEIERLNLRDRVFMFDEIPNTEIWQFYRMADVFVNLNKREIWGMALLEAMYYRVGIIAADAPGPRCITGNGEYGFLAESDEELLEFLKIDPFPQKISAAAFERVTAVFRWKKTAEIIMSLIESAELN